MSMSEGLHYRWSSTGVLFKLLFNVCCYRLLSSSLEVLNSCCSLSGGAVAADEVRMYSDVLFAVLLYQCHAHVFATVM